MLQRNEMGKSAPPTAASNRQSDPVPMDVDTINKDHPPPAQLSAEQIQWHKERKCICCGRGHKGHCNNPKPGYNKFFNLSKLPAHSTEACVTETIKGTLNFPAPANADRQEFLAAVAKQYDEEKAKKDKVQGKKPEVTAARINEVTDTDEISFLLCSM
jgi:hypothetical protein